jgi:hypothetical protein
MRHLADTILAYAQALPEGTPLMAKELLHLGSRAAVDQALSRLKRRGALLRAGRGIYVQPVESRFGKRPPAAATLVASLARKRGETVVPHAAMTANSLGLTTQVPVREVYLTSGPSRRFQLGGQSVELRHAPGWQLLHPGQLAGDVVRVLAWLGPEQAGEALSAFKERLSPRELADVAATRSRLPTWLAQAVSTLIAHD